MIIRAAMAYGSPKLTRPLVETRGPDQLMPIKLDEREQGRPYATLHRGVISNRHRTLPLGRFAVSRASSTKLP